MDFGIFNLSGKMKKILFVFGLLSLLVWGSCKDDGVVNQLLFPVGNDINLGQQLDSTILANPADYPILDEFQYPTAYFQIRRIRDLVLNTSAIEHRNDFAWEVKIIQDDATLNAFAAPGGFIYVYTGLIKFLDTEDQLAGVMGHEIAHADQRHSINQLKKQFGVQLLLDLALGQNQGVLTQVAAGLLALSFSRDDEAEADEFSVIYLCETDYNASGAAGFFEKIEAAGGSSGPEFLSTHPDPGNRVQDIQANEDELGCTGTVTQGQYQDLLNSLP